MHILKKRPLATILIVLLSGFSLFGKASMLVRILLCTALGLAWLILACIRTLPRRRMVHILCITCALSFLLSFLYFDYAFPVIDETEETVTLDGYIEDIVYTDGFFTTAYMHVDTVNAQPGTRCRVCVSDEAGNLLGIEAGDRLTVQATILPKADDHQLSQGICATVQVLERTDDGRRSPHGWTVFRHTQVQRFEDHIEAIADEDTAALLTALLLGERAYMTEVVQQDFSRIGITHLLALSGLHLSILSLLLVTLLSALRVNKSIRHVLLCLFVIGYILLTGAPASLLRAGLMLVLGSSLFLLHHPHDPLTTLCMTLTLICAVSPYAIYDIGLWLSALATLGILLLTQLQGKTTNKAPLPWWARPLRVLWQSVAVSLCAQAAALLLSVLCFDSLSLISPAATFVFGFLVQIYIYLGLLCACLGGPLPFLGDTLSHLTALIEQTAARWSSGRFVLVDASFDATHILVALFTVALVLFVLCPVRRKRAAIGVLACLFVAVYGCAFALTYQARARDTQLYTSTASADGFVITSDTHVALIDIGTGGAPLGEHYAALLHAQHVRYLDAYVVTRYSVYLSSTVRTVADAIRCERVYLPTPSNEEEMACCQTLLQLLRQYKIDFTFYNAPRGCTIGQTEITIPYRTCDGLRTYMWLHISDDTTSTVYFSRGSVDRKTQTAASEQTAHADVVVFGCCGYVTKDALDMPLSTRVRLCILSDPTLLIRTDRYEQYQSTAKIVVAPVQYNITR